MNIYIICDKQMRSDVVFQKHFRTSRDHNQLFKLSFSENFYILRRLVWKILIGFRHIICISVNR